MKKTDLQLKQDVENELLWDPKINAARIDVSVDGGAISLSGAVDSYAEKSAAERATKRIAGVRAVSEKLSVSVLGHHVRADAEIADAVRHALEWDVWAPSSVTATVHKGAVTLHGHVEWQYQRDAATRAVCYLAGVASVHNEIAIAPRASTADVIQRVQAALQRQAKADAESRYG